MRALVLMLALAGCDHWRTCDDLSDWSVEVSRVGYHEGAAAAAARVPDGTIVVAISDPFGDVQFGDQVLHGPHLARVSADGDVLATVALPDQMMHNLSALRASADRVAVQWPGVMPVPVITVYDADFNGLFSTGGFNFDVGPGGVMVLTSSSMQTPVLVYLDPGGTERWTRPLGGIGLAHLLIADNGDVFTFGSDSTGAGGSHRWRYAAADGALVDDLPLPINPEVVAPDGAFYRASYNPDGSSSALVERYDVRGVKLWSKVHNAFSSSLLTTTGDLIAQTSYEGLHGTTFKLLHIDGTTGERLSEDVSCAPQIIFAADADHYFVLGSEGSDSPGLARFPLR